MIENAGNPGTSLADGPEKNEGDPEWIRREFFVDELNNRT